MIYFLQVENRGVPLDQFRYQIGLLRYIYMMSVELLVKLNEKGAL